MEEQMKELDGMKPYRDIRELDSKNRVVIPACLCRKLGIKSGDALSFSYGISDGRQVLIIDKDPEWQGYIAPKARKPE